MEILDMERIHSYGARSTQYLQENYAEAQDWFLLISSAADLRTAFLLLFPILFHLQPAAGVKLVWVAVLGDWLNLICKWLLFGERPYWWVHETAFYVNGTVPNIQQFPLTCETGPGSPSGHAMGAAGVRSCHGGRRGTLLTSALDALPRHNGSSAQRWCMKALLWTGFWVVQVAVGVSRVFIAAHFPHQVFSGALGGLLVAGALSRSQWIQSVSLRGYVQLSLLLLASALGLYALLDAAAVDLLWSVAKAHRWCAHPGWVRLETTPFASLTRNTGILLGLGMALHLPMWSGVLQSRGERACCRTHESSAPFRLACVGATVLVLHVLDTFRPPVCNAPLFFLLSFCKSATVPLTVVGLVPFCTARVMRHGAGTRVWGDGKKQT